MPWFIRELSHSRPFSDRPNLAATRRFASPHFRSKPVRHGTPCRKVPLTNGPRSTSEFESFAPVWNGQRGEKWHFGTGPRISISNQRVGRERWLAAGDRRKRFDVLRVWPASSA